MKSPTGTDRHVCCQKNFTTRSMNTCVSAMCSATHIPLTSIGRNAPLVLRLEETFQKLEKAMDDFLN